ncbi:TPA: ATP-binding cassette domain-containing protein [Vibrio parahaemolyticus]
MLSMNNVSIYQRYTQEHVLRSLTFSVKPNEIVALVGESGGGKSLLAQLLMKALPDDFNFSGQIVNSYSTALIAQHATALNPDLKIRQQLELFRCSHMQLLPLLKTVELSEEIVNAYPYQLSGGIAKRVLACLAIMQNSSLIIADEPTCGLDPERSQRLMALFRSLSKLDKSFLLISHDLPLMMSIADRVIVLANGEIIEEVSPNQIKNGHCDYYTSALWQAQPQFWSQKF